MNDLGNLINFEINKIENVLLDNRINSTDRAISMYLLSSWKKKNELPTIKILSEKLYISVSSISKYIKKYDLKGFPVLKFIFSINKNMIDNKNKPEEDKEIKKAAERIMQHNKILLVGTGNSGLMAKGFYTRLVLNGVNAIFVEGKPDQIRMINQMGDNDLIICISISMSHQWTKNLINSNKNLIFFTNQNINIKNNIQVFFPKDSITLKYSQINTSSYSYINEKIDSIIQVIKSI